MQQPAPKKKMSARTSRLIHMGIMWLLCDTAYRFITFLLFVIFFSAEIDAALYYEDLVFPRTVTVAVSLISVPLFAAMHTYIRGRSEGERRRALIKDVKEGSYRLIPHFKKNYLSEILLYVAVHAALQLLFCVFYAFFGFRFDDSQTFIEKLHIADSGFYLLTRIPILGLLLNSAYMFISLAAARLTLLTVWRRDEDNFA